MNNTLDRIKKDLENEIAELQKALAAIMGIGQSKGATARSAQENLANPPPQYQQNCTVTHTSSGHVSSIYSQPDQGASAGTQPVQQPVTQQQLPPAMAEAIKQTQFQTAQAAKPAAPPYLARKAQRIAEGQKRGR